MSESLLALVPGLPLLGAIINAVINRRVPRPVTGAIASGAVLISALISFGFLFDLLGAHGEAAERTLTLYTWIAAGDFSADIGFLVDPLSVTFMCIITGIGFLIHVYSIGYLDEDVDAPSVWRFFAYLNLFIFAMLLLVMGDNFLLMFVGWEGVGVCSYLLIGFWFSDTANAVAGKKAFVTNRVGDFMFILGLFWLFWTLGDAATVNFRALEAAVSANPALVGGIGGLAVTGICMLFFGGATGKSAQIPLYIWLPDAMAGPTPVSALIHAATMVTAGIYMICRLSFLYAMAPAALGLVALTGALTAFLAASIAMAQYDIKKVLAYSTVSQLGYMFMGVGLGAFTAGFFHVMTHAFFKALLFLGSGSIIHALHHEQDMRNMGGLRRYMPITFGTFTIAWLAICGIPGFSGFFSKDEILWLALNTPAENLALFGDYSGWIPTFVWFLGFVTAVMTAFYMSRLYFMTFFGTYRGGGHGDHGHGAHTPHESPATITFPLVVLALLALFGGLINLPHYLPGSGGLHHFLEPVFASATSILAEEHSASTAAELGVAGVTVLAILGSIAAAWRLYGRPRPEGEPLDPLPAIGAEFFTGAYHKWFVDEIYEALILRPLYFLSEQVLHPIVDVLIIDGAVNGAARAATGLGGLYGRFVQSGRIPVYAIALAGGTAAIVLLFAVG